MPDCPDSTDCLPRMPYGVAKAIVCTMNIGDTVVARPPYVVSLLNAAHRLGIRLASVRFDRGGDTLVRMVRIAEGWRRTGHAVCRRPRRDRSSGRWLKDEAA